MSDHPDGYPTFAPPFVVPDGIRRKIIEADTIDGHDATLILQLIEAGLAAINLRRAERDYGRRELLLRTVKSYRLEVRAARLAEELIERRQPSRRQGSVTGSGGD